MCTGPLEGDGEVVVMGTFRARRMVVMLESCVEDYKEGERDGRVSWRGSGIEGATCGVQRLGLGV